MIKEIVKSTFTKIIEQNTYIEQETLNEARFKQALEMDHAERLLMDLPDHDDLEVMRVLTGSDKSKSDIYSAIPHESSRNCDRISEIYTYLLTSSGDIYIEDTQDSEDEDKIGPHCPIYYVGDTIDSPDIVVRSTVKIKSGIRALDVPLMITGRERPPSFWNKFSPLPITMNSGEAGAVARQIQDEHAAICFAQETSLQENIESNISSEKKGKIIGPIQPSGFTYEVGASGE